MTDRSPVSGTTDSKTIRIDAEVAHSSRVYDYLMGGSDNFPADREAAEQAAQAVGGLDVIRAHIRSNRAFIGRVVRYLAAAGVRQFLDIGTGVPHPDGVPAMAQQVAPETRIVYVDNDPIVLAHAHSLLRASPEGANGYIYGDLRDPEEILRRAGETLDFDEPVAVMLMAVLHFLGPGDRPHDLVARLRKSLCPGSYMAVSHLTQEVRPTETIAASKVLGEMTRDRFTPRSHGEIGRFFEGFDLVEPGVVQIDDWHPDPETPSVASLGEIAPFYGAVGVKP